MSTSSYSLIEKLLEFQNSFINLIHSEILAFNEPQQKKQALLKFQILRMSDKNESFNETVSTLRKELIEQKQEADTVLKSYFTKILDLDYLPFLHINRYELTKLSIFGFDIYIDPLQAILQILNRLERTFYILEESLKEHSEQYLALQQKGSWQILLSGWSNYYIYLNFYKLSLNIYMLNEYIQTADTSLFKKDKEIIFTGVYNFYKKLVPRLIEMNQLQFLQELADLNNTMYSFHGSFDYFLFYTCLKPEKKLIKVYERIKDLERKCKTTNILTPLLFGILNNFKSFKLFVNQVQSPDYIHLLRLLLSGLVINFKLRILEYDQVLELIGAAITKLNLLKGMKFEIISGDLGKEWREAKDFFISAFKSGYNVGEIQTWNLCKTEKIQPKIRNYLTEGTLLLENCKYDEFIKSLENQELEEILSYQISELTSGTETLSSITNNWKKITISQIEQVDSKCLNVIRIVNLMNVLENYSEKLLYTTCSAIIEINCKSPLLQLVLADSAETINSMITVINRKESISNLKYILPEFHKKYTPKNTFQDIVPVYLHCFIIKQSLQNLLNVIQSLEKEQTSLYIKQLLTSLIQKHCPKYQNTFETLKNFQKEYKIPYEVVHMDSEITSVFTNLTKIITISEGKKFQTSSEMLINLLRYCPWYVISVLNLPTLIDDKIQSFLSWMIKSESKKSSLILSQMLDLITKFSEEKQSGNLKEYLQECVYFSVLDTILNFLSERTKGQKWYEDCSNIDRIISLVELYVQIQAKFMSLSQIQVSLVHQNEGIQKVWYNLLELLSFILRNGEFALEKVSRSCQIYWRIIKRIRGQSIGQWYQKMLFNLVFSTSGSESLSSYETFKGITLISSSKNYMTSKEPHSQNSQNQKDSSSQRYNFSQVKQFFDEKYLSLQIHNNKSSNLEDLMAELNKLTQQSVKDKTQMKISSIHLTNYKESLPSISQSMISSIYLAYCNGSDKEKQLAKFCLSFLKLNSSNHKMIWNMAKGNEKSQFLSELKFTRETIGQIFEIIQKIQKSTPGQKDRNQILLNMLNLQLLSQSVNELELLSSSFYFEAQKIQTFLKKRQQMWFLIVCNNSNWREFNEVFSTYLKNQNFMSTLLQYKEFLTITKKSSKDYEEKIDHFAQILSQYQFYIQKKIDFIHLLKSTDSSQENDIRKSTLILNVKLALLKCQFERILERMVNVGKLISQNSLQNSSFKNLISSIHSLNNLCNFIAEGNIELPSFSYHNGYLTENSELRQFVLGRWLENVEKVFGDEIGTKYQPKKDFFTVKKSIKDFLGDKENQSENLMLRVLDKVFDYSTLSQQYSELKKSLNQYLVQDQRNLIEITCKPQIEKNQEIQSKFYQLGHLLCLENLKNNQNTEQHLQKVSPLLRSLIKRETLPLQLVKEVDPQSYHHLKLILMDQKQNDPKVTQNQAEEQPQTTQKIDDQKDQQKEKSQDHFFVWREKQLIEGGKTIKVNQNNKIQYLDLVATQVLGKNYLLLNKALALGYINAIFINQN